MAYTYWVILSHDNHDKIYVKNSKEDNSTDIKVNN